MKKWLSAVVGLAVMLCLSILAVPVRADMMEYSYDGIMVDGLVYVPTYTPVIKVGGNNYVAIRYFAEATGLSVGWDSENEIVAFETQDLYVPSSGTDGELGNNWSSGEVSPVKLDIRVSIDGTVYDDIPAISIDGTSLLQLAALTRHLGYTLVNDNTIYTYDRSSITSSPVRLDIASGSIQVCEKPDCVLYRQNDTKYCGTGGCIIQQSNNGTPTANTIAVQSGEVSLTISGLNIEASAAPIAVSNGAKLTLDLVGSSTLKAGYNYAGIQVPWQASLLICGDGAVTSTGGENGAGIGGGTHSDGGTITISSGTVTAIGGEYGAGIGGGSWHGDGGTITISGGVVTATGGENGAGIGGGWYGDGGMITIIGGTVTTKSNKSAGIGGGKEGHGGTVFISNATVEARGKYCAIGGGGLGNEYGCDSITVSDGAEMATGSSNYRERIDYEASLLDSAAFNGHTALFSTVANGHSGVCYQWQQSETGMDWTWEDIPDETGQILMFPVSVSNNDCYVRCVITNGWGYTVCTDAAQAHILAFTQQPQSVETNLNNVASLSVEPSCDNVTYQWQRSYDDGETWTDVSGESYSTLFVNATLSENDALYRCVITAANGDRLASDAAHIAVAFNTALAATISGSTLTCTVTAPKGAVLIAAGYDTDGRMTGVYLTSADTDWNGQTMLVTLAAGAAYKLFLLDGVGGVPLCPAWE